MSRRITVILNLHARLMGWLIALCLTLGTSAQAQVYTLQSGDVVQAEIIRLGNQRWKSTIDVNGFVRFPYFGRFFAAGKTLDELQEEISLTVVGQRITLMQGSQDTVIVLDEASVFIDVAEYRPVTIYGKVNAPGNIAYRSGMTVRAVLGIAGGLRLLPDPQSTRPDRSALLSTRIEELRKTEAWLLVDLWRIKGQLDPKHAEIPPSEFEQILTTRIDPINLEDVRARISEAQREKELELVDLQNQKALTQDRIGYLARALEQYEVVSESEQERLANLLTLQDRGLTVASSVNSARAGTMFASSRLLQTEADISEARRELATLERKLAALPLDIRQDLLAEQAQVLKNLDEIRARLKGSSEEFLQLTGQIRTSELEDYSAIEPSFVLHRQQNDVVLSSSINLNEMVLPGDVIEVVLGAGPDPEQ